MAVYGQLGDGTNTDRMTPAVIPNLAHVWCGLSCATPAAMSPAARREDGRDRGATVAVAVVHLPGGGREGTLAAGAEKEVTFVVDLPTASGGRSIDLELGVTGPGEYDVVSSHMRIAVAPDITWQVTLPAVSATPPLVAVTAPAVGVGNSVHIVGEVNADGAARDVYVRVWNRSLKMPVRKVFCRNAPANSARLPFEADVPIWSGNNLVTVSARDARGTEATRAVVVLRKD